MGQLRIFLLIVFLVMAVLTILTKHLIFKGLVNDANVGWWERAFAIVLVGWTGVAAYALERRLLALARSESNA
jgi:lipoprotein signal peptidase